MRTIGTRGELRLAKRGFDDHGTKAARIDENLSFKFAAVRRQQRLHIARAIQLDRPDPGIDMFNAAARRHLAQIGAH